MIYQMVNPIRKCLCSGGRYTKSCNFPRIVSGVCTPVYDAKGRLVIKRCAKAQNQ